MNILYLTWEGLTEPMGYSQILPFLSNLAKRGIKIHVLSLEDEHMYRKGKKRIKEIVQNDNIKWTAMMYSNKIPVVSFLQNYSKMRTQASKLCRKHTFDIVHCRSYLMASIGFHLKKHYRTKFLFDMRMFYADDKVDTHAWEITNPVYRLLYLFFKNKEQNLFSHSDYIVTKTETSKNILEKDYHVQVPTSVIPSCVDFNLFNRESVTFDEQETLRNRLGVTKDDFVISYIGSLGNCYMLNEMMNFVGELMKVKTQTKFLVITPDSEELVLTSAKKYGVDSKKIIVDFTLRNQMPTYISIMDVSIFFISPVFSKKASSPKKMGEVLSLGIPIITNKGVGDVNAIVNNGAFGLLIDDFSLQSYRQVISQLDNLLKTDPSLCSDAAKAYFSLEKGADEYAKIYQLLSSE
jgi:glycosyltransferase involved in cell wall biosynthesis